MANLLTRTLVALICLLAIIAAGLWIDHCAETRGIEIGKNEVRAEVQSTALAAQSKNDEAHRLQVENLLGAINAEKLRSQTLTSDSERLHVERDRLRSQARDFASGGDVSSGGVGPNASHAQALAEVFSECVDRYSDVAAKADGHYSDEVMLEQGWPK